MTRIYLAKSNRSNPDDVSRVRQVLSRYDVEIVEYKGGGYTHKDLLSCDFLVIVPDLSEYDEDNYVPLGKGLHEQIEAFKDRNNICDMLIVIDTTEYQVEITTLDSLECADEDDFVNYSTAALVESTGETLDNVLENRLGSPTSKPSKTTTSYSDYKYLVIGK